MKHHIVSIPTKCKFIFTVILFYETSRLQRKEHRPGRAMADPAEMPPVHVHRAEGVCQLQTDDL